MNRRQQQVIKCLLKNVGALNELHGNKRLDFTDDQYARLTRKGKLLGSARLNEAATLVTPNTILKQQRMPIGKSSGWAP